MLNPSDSVQRFLFEHLDVRGAVVRLNQTCQQIQSTHYYPPALAKILNEFAGAVCLLRDSIKIHSAVTLQLRTNGPVSLIMADCMSDKSVRAICEYDSESFPSSTGFSFGDLEKGSTLTITISPEEGERYQGIVPIENASLEACLEDYFTRSEQLPTRFRLLADSDKVIAVSLHALPQQKVQDNHESSDAFERLSAFLKTMLFEEAESLSNESMLTRLFHQDACRLFEAQPLKFGCHCSAARSLNAIVSLGEHEVKELVAEQHAAEQTMIEVDCHFCFQRYQIPINEVLEALTTH